MTTKDHRKHIPIGTKLHATLLLLGFTEEQIVGGQIQWDHYPALGLRVIDEATGEMMPAPNDPKYIRPMLKEPHAIKTNGTKATTAGSDKHAIAKVKRLNGETPKRKGQKIQSRGFPKRSGKKW